MRDARQAADRDRLELSSISDRSIARLVSWAPSDEFWGPAYWNGRALPGVGDVLEGEPRLLCTSPQEWLLVVPTKRTMQPAKMVGPGLLSESLSLVDVTAGLGVVEVRGPAAASFLSKSCGLDFNPLTFGASRCARVRFANIAVVIHCMRSSELFELYFARSYTAFLGAWLADAAMGIHA